MPGRVVKKRRHLPLLPLLGGLVVVLVIVNIAVLLVRPRNDGPATTGQREGALPEASASATTGSATPGTKAAAKADFGVFVGSDAAAARKFERWLGRPLQDVVDFGGRQTWAEISNPTYVLQAWRDTKYRLIFAVPMLPDSLAATKNTAMARGAQGDYDRYFEQLATRLVANGHEDAVLRIGWEFNLTTWAWGIEDHEVFVQYFRRVVTAMRSVPGQKFNINWNPNNGFNPYDAVKYWPGNNFVDSVGLDAYDVDRNRYPYPKNCSTICRETRQQTAWDEVVYGGPRGLSFWTNFAQQHKKPFSLPEWSMWQRYDGTGGGDNPLFLKQMQFFIDAPANNVEFASYFNRDSPDGKHQLERYYPVGSKVFRQLFGAKAAT